MFQAWCCMHICELLYIEYILKVVEGPCTGTPSRFGHHNPGRGGTPSSASGSTRGADAGSYGKVEVNSDGWITPACDGKNRWHSDLRGEVLRWLDLSITEFRSQNKADWAAICKDMLERWEYDGNDGKGPVEDCMSEYAMRILKQERHRLKKMWLDSGSNRRMPPPPLMDTDQWTRLIKGFMSEAGQSKSEQMSLARGKVKNLSQAGRGSYAPVREQLVRISIVWVCHRKMQLEDYSLKTTVGCTIRR